MRPAEQHSPSAEENCLTENVASLRSVKVATPPCAAKAAIPCGLAVRKQHKMLFAASKFEGEYSHNLRNKDCIPLTQEEFAQKLADRNEIQSYRMKQFQQSGHDCYLVMQLHQDADPALRFAAMRYLNKQNTAPSVENYEILYRGNLPEGKRSVPQAELLEQLYQKFNFARPTDYHGHSLSVSDVIAIKRNGEVSVHYVDSIGFKELPGFLDTKPERPSVLMNLKEKCDAPECNPTVCRKARDAHEL